MDEEPGGGQPVVVELIPPPLTVEKNEFPMTFRGEVLGLIDELSRELKDIPSGPRNQRRAAVVLRGLLLLRTARGRTVTIDKGGRDEEYVHLWGNSGDR